MLQEVSSGFQCILGGFMGDHRVSERLQGLSRDFKKIKGVFKEVKGIIGKFQDSGVSETFQ